MHQLHRATQEHFKMVLIFLLKSINCAQVLLYYATYKVSKHEATKEAVSISSCSPHGSILFDQNLQMSAQLISSGNLQEN